MKIYKEVFNNKLVAPKRNKFTNKAEQKESELARDFCALQIFQAEAPRRETGNLG